jgi:pimeloyl-ACP methyl ester carboxylesterase
MPKPPIIILHGWGLSREKFTVLKDILAKRGYVVYAPDFPGFGTSEIPKKPLHLSDYADFLHTYIVKNKIKNPVLIGHSFGGRVSLKYQMMFPNSIRALILTGTPGYTPVARKKIMVSIALAKIGKFIFSMPPFNFLKERVRGWYYYLVGARDYYRANEVMREIFKNIVQEDLLAPMNAVTAPCMLVWGKDDIITPVWIAEKMHETIHHSVLSVIPETGHGVSYKQPEVFADSIKQFLATL